MTNNLDQAKQKVLEENTAQAVFKNLRLLENKRNRFRARWAIELLQNARDSSEEAGVEVAFNVDEGKLTFQHTGRPFTESNIVHLIYHGSSKVDDDDHVGHFGTGFISTHLISKSVQVRGSLDGDKDFNFTLDREGESPKELQGSMEKSWRLFKESLRPSGTHTESVFSTEYIYKVENENIREMVKDGVSEISNNAGFILAFNNELRAIHVNSNGKKKTFKKTEVNVSTNHCAYIQIEEENNGVRSCVLTI